MTEESTKATGAENAQVEEKRETLTLPKEKEKNLEEIYKNGLHATKQENKALKEKIAEFERIQKEANDKKLAEEGKYKELLEAKQRELAELNSNIEKERATRKKDNTLNKIKLKAQEMGAYNPDAITKFLDVEGLIDGDEEVINKAINQLKEKESYLFSNKKKSASDENNSVFSGSDKKPKSFSDAFSMAMKGKAF